MREEDRIRYSRLIAIDDLGKEGVEKLQKSVVTVVGCGALGSMVAMQLAASGVGKLRIIDFDTIDLSNLQRQFFFKTSETGRAKVEILRKRISDLNPNVEIEVFREILDHRNARRIISGSDFVVEATDNPDSMRLIDSICNEVRVNCVLAGVSEFAGQVMTCVPGGRRYTDIFPQQDNNGILPCSLGGVAGPAASMAASVEAAETIKSITGYGDLLSERMFVFDLLNMSFIIIQT